MTGDRLPDERPQPTPAPAEAVLVYVTAPPPEAEALARSIVEHRRAACVNILPRMRSIYRWQDAVESDEEALLVIKSTAAGLNALVQHVHDHHPYDVPEVIATPISGGAAGYLAWVHENVDAPGSMA